MILNNIHRVLIFGGVMGEVKYVSGDTLKENKGKGEEIYYRVHVIPSSSPVKTTSGKIIEILPVVTAQVDVKTSDRTVLDYLLKPFKKTCQNHLESGKLLLFTILFTVSSIE